MAWEMLPKQTRKNCQMTDKRLKFNHNIDVCIVCRPEACHLKLTSLSTPASMSVCIVCRQESYHLTLILFSTSLDNVCIVYRQESCHLTLISFLTSLNVCIVCRQEPCRLKLTLFSTRFNVCIVCRREVGLVSNTSRYRRLFIGANLPCSRVPASPRHSRHAFLP